MTKFDFDSASQGTRLLQKRKELSELEIVFLQKNEEFIIENQKLDLREKAIKEKDEALQRSLVKFNRYIRENEIKKNRAQAKIQEEIKAQTDITEKLASLKEESNLLEQEHDRLKTQIRETSGSRKYLLSVLEAFPHQFTDIEDIINRYNVLKQSHDEVKTQTEGLQSSIEELEASIDTTHTEQKELISNLENDYSNINNQILAQRNAREELYREKSAADDELIDVLNDFGTVVLCLNSLKDRIKETFGKYLKHDIASNIQEPSLQSIVDVEVKQVTLQGLTNIDILNRYVKDLILATNQ